MCLLIDHMHTIYFLRIMFYRSGLTLGRRAASSLRSNLSNYTLKQHVPTVLSTITRRNLSNKSLETALNSDFTPSIPSLKEIEQGNVRPWEDLEADIASSMSQDELNLAHGVVIFDSRSSANLTYKIRVLRHKQANAKELLEFQVVYDGGDDYNDEAVVVSKSIVEVGKYKELHLPSTCAIVSALVFSQQTPKSVLLLSSWGGSLARYISSAIGADVTIVDPDLVSKEASRELVQFSPEEACPPKHPFDVAMAKGDVDASLKEVIALHMKKPTGTVTQTDCFTDARSYLTSLFAQGISQNVNEDIEAVLFDRERFENEYESYQRELEDHKILTELKQTKPETVVPEEPVFNFQSAIQDNPFKDWDPRILASATQPVKLYDVVIQDSEASPHLLDMDALCRIKMALYANRTEEDEHCGAYIRRVTIPQAGSTTVSAHANLDFISPSDVCEQLQQVFTHVYWGQASVDSVIVVATDSCKMPDNSYHPVTKETLCDLGVTLWDKGLFTLDIMERTDCFNPYTGNFDAELVTDAEKLYE